NGTGYRLRLLAPGSRFGDGRRYHQESDNEQRECAEGHQGRRQTIACGPHVQVRQLTSARHIDRPEESTGRDSDEAGAAVEKVSIGNVRFPQLPRRSSNGMEI